MKMNKKRNRNCVNDTRKKKHVWFNINFILENQW